MIKLTRETAPSVLVDNGPAAIMHLCVRHDLQAYKFSTCSDDFSASIYSSQAVKDALGRCQNNKCCYCEMKFPADYPEVEHYRPKGAVIIGESKSQLPTGYYWLAYSWDNLLLCKTKINKRYKRKFFPLEVESNRARKHGDDTNLEAALLINPFDEDPREHIRFHQDEPFPITEKGRFSIKYYGLRDAGISEARKELFDDLAAIKDALEVLHAKSPGDPLIKKFELRLEKAVKPTSQFSSMAIDLLQLVAHSP